jgi:hypothetical protein
MKYTIIQLLSGTIKNITGFKKTLKPIETKKGVTIYDPKTRKKIHVNVVDKANTMTIPKQTKYKGVSYINVNKKDVRRYDLLKNPIRKYFGM